VTDSLLYWGLGLLALSLVLVIVEVLLPTAGVVGTVSFIIAIVGVVCLFRHDWRWGLSGLLALLVLGPAAVFFGLQIFPSTPMGRKIIIENPFDDRPPAEAAGLAELIDAEGTALTDLRPGGFVQVIAPGSTGRRVAATSEVAFIKAGSRIRVTGADGMQVRVRPVA
jgi:membrane-bound ClpP family serine protease